MASGVVSLQDIPADIIESVEVLKGPAAAALYGSAGSVGAIMVTTKRGSGNILKVDVNSNTMLQLGFTVKPKYQKSYGRGINGRLDTDYVWGPKLDIGDSAAMWNPHTFQIERMPLVSSGRNNLENFMETAMVTNNTISLSQGNDKASVRATVNHVYQKGSFPNQHLNTLNASITGEIRASKRMSIRADMGYVRRGAPQVFSNGYNDQGYLYQLIMWTGPEYDIRDYRNYWAVPYQDQNWMYNNWYDNPYAIAYEKKFSRTENKFYGNLNINYKLATDLNLLVRPALNFYAMDYVNQNPTGRFFSNRAGFDARGLFSQSKYSRIQSLNDAILTYKKRIGDFGIDAMVGGSMNFDEYDALSARTVGGLISPTFYSIRGSVEQPTVSVDHSERMIISGYGRLGLSWKNALFVEGTGRQEYNSSQYKSSGAFFYPSLSGSVVLSEFIKMPQAVDMFKFRGSWVQVKVPLGVYSDNMAYSTGTASWVSSLGSFNTANYPSSLTGAGTTPTTERTWEVGAAAYLFQKRLHVDFAYFNKLYYNLQTQAIISSASGFTSTLINYDYEYVRRGYELTIDGTVIKNRKFEWNSLLNLNSFHSYYKQLDSVYSSKRPEVKKGARIDQVWGNFWESTGSGELIHYPNGRPRRSSGSGYFFGYSDPKFEIGFVNNFRFNNFVASIAFDGRIGGVMYNYVYDKQFDAGTSPETDNQYRYDQVVKGLNNYVGQGVKVVSGSIQYDNFGRVISDTREFAPNDIAVGYQNYIRDYRGGDEGYQNKGFVKLRELALGYTIPNKLLKKTGLTAATVSVTGQNLFIWTKFKFSDPDVNAEDLNSPSYRVLGLNFKLSF